METIFYYVKTGKILRIQDGRTLSEMSKEKYEKIIKEFENYLKVKEFE